MQKIGEEKAENIEVLSLRPRAAILVKNGQHRIPIPMSILPSRMQMGKWIGQLLNNCTFKEAVL